MRCVLKLRWIFNSLVKVILLGSFSVGSIAGSQSLYCPYGSSEYEIGGYAVNVCTVGQNKGLFEKTINGKNWAGEFGPSAIALFRLADTPGYVWMLATPFVGKSLPDESFQTRSKAYLMRYDCNKGTTQTVKTIKYSESFGQGRVLEDTNYHTFSDENVGFRMIYVPCKILRRAGE